MCACTSAWVWVSSLLLYDTIHMHLYLSTDHRKHTQTHSMHIPIHMHTVYLCVCIGEWNGMETMPNNRLKTKSHTWCIQLSDAIVAEQFRRILACVWYHRRLVWHACSRFDCITGNNRATESVDIAIVTKMSGTAHHHKRSDSHRWSYSEKCSAWNVEHGKIQIHFSLYYCLH